MCSSDLIVAAVETALDDQARVAEVYVCRGGRVAKCSEVLQKGWNRGKKDLLEDPTGLKGRGESTIMIIEDTAFPTSTVTVATSAACATYLQSRETQPPQEGQEEWQQLTGAEQP